MILQAIVRDTVFVGVRPRVITDVVVLAFIGLLSTIATIVSGILSKQRADMVKTAVEATKAENKELMKELHKDVEVVKNAVNNHPPTVADKKEN